MVKKRGEKEKKKKKKKKNESSIAAVFGFRSGPRFSTFPPPPRSPLENQTKPPTKPPLPLPPRPQGQPPSPSPASQSPGRRQRQGRVEGHERGREPRGAKPQAARLFVAHLCPGVVPLCRLALFSYFVLGEWRSRIWEARGRRFVGGADRGDEPGAARVAGGARARCRLGERRAALSSSQRGQIERESASHPRFGLLFFVCSNVGFFYSESRSFISHAHTKKAFVFPFFFFSVSLSLSLSLSLSSLSLRNKNKSAIKSKKKKAGPCFKQGARAVPRRPPRPRPSAPRPAPAPGPRPPPR